MSRPQNTLNSTCRDFNPENQIGTLETLTLSNPKASLLKRPFISKKSPNFFGIGVCDRFVILAWGEMGKVDGFWT